LVDAPLTEKREWWFTQVALFICGWMLLAPFLERPWLAHHLMQLVLLNALLTTLKVNPEWRSARRLAIGLWTLGLAGSLVGVASAPAAWDRSARTAETLSYIPLLVLLSTATLRFVFRSRRLTIDGVLATVVVYVILAFVFTQLYYLLLLWNPQSFALPDSPAARPPHLLRVDLLYYSLITQCSVGYGDILPRSDIARMLAAIQAVLGQFYMAVVVAVFVGMYAARRHD
jgi:voltage-gated potassium channel